MTEDEIKNKLLQEQKADLRTILKDSQLNLDLFAVCLNINTEVVKGLIADDKEIALNAERIFTDPREYLKQKEVAAKTEAEIRKVLQIDEKIAANAEKIKKMKRVEIFAIFRPQTANENKEKSAVLERVLRLYYEQTAELSEFIPNSDMFYTKYGRMNSAAVKREKEQTDDLLDLVGTYAEQPQIENILQEKIGRFLAYHSYNKDENEPRGLPSVRKDEFFQRMRAELETGDSTLKKQFYIKYAPLVVDDKFFKNERFAIYCSRHIIADMKQTLLNSPESAEAKYYVQNCNEFLGFDGVTEIATEVVPQLKDKYPQICDKLCDNMVKSAQTTFYGQKMKYAVNRMSDYDVKGITLYSAYPHKGLAQMMTNAVEKNEFSRNDTSWLYEAAQKTGLPCFDKALDTVLKKGGATLKVTDDTVDYKPLLEKIAKSPDITTLFITGMENYEVEKLIAQCPNLREAHLHRSNNKDGQRLYDELLISKPENLHVLEAPLEPAQMVTLMKKYPDLKIKSVNNTCYNGEVSEMNYKNDKFIEGIQSENPLQYFAKAGRLLDYLQWLPQDEKPTLADLLKPDDNGKSCIDTWKEKFNSNEYYQLLQKIADVINSDELKTRLELRDLAKEDKLMEFLQNASKEELPPLKYLYSGNIAFNNSSILAIIRQNSEDEDSFAAKSLQILDIIKPDDNDLAELQNLEFMREPLYRLQAKQTTEQNQKLMMSAFEKWKEAKGIKR